MQAFQAYVSRKMKDQFSEMYAFIHESVTCCVKLCLMQCWVMQGTVD